MNKLYVATRFYFLIAASLLFTRGFSQTQATDSSFLAKATQHAIGVYSNSIGDQAGLYNGVEYKGYVEHNTDTGHPYFKSNDWTEGTVEYDGGRYENVALLYDLLSDRVILEQPYSGFKLELISEKIKSFSLSGHKFVRLLGNANDSTVHTGFYDLLYDGRIKVLAKRRKHIEQRIETLEVLIRYKESDRLIIFKSGRYFTVKSRSSVLKVFEDRKKELRKYINKNNLDFRTDRDHSIAQVAKFYDESEP